MAARTPPRTVPMRLACAACASRVTTAAAGRHVVFAPVTLHCYQAPYTITALAPLAVRPAWQRGGIGSVLMRQGLAACATAGRDVVVVVGHPAFYPRFGFVRARPLGLMSEPAYSADTFMVAELTPGALRGRRGVVLYSADF